MSDQSSPLRILAFEPFDAGSHRAVRESIERHSRHTWRWLTRPGRAWKWRMRLAAVEFAGAIPEAVAELGPPDVIVATSLLSVADLRSLLPRTLRGLPIALVMHENQAAYPPGSDADAIDRQRDLHFALTNLTSVLAADRVFWNSAWNRDSFLDGISRIIRRSPDWTGDIDAMQSSIRDQSEIIPMPVEVDPQSIPARSRPGPPGERLVRVVWPHRWEHDKGPDALLDVARRHSESLDLRWTILGERYRRTPGALETFAREFHDRIDHLGFIEDRDAYLATLASCDWVLSTARHEFFGIAVVEAMLCGCLPWLPDRLSYPELLPDEAKSISPWNPPTDADGVRRAIGRHLSRHIAPGAVATIDGALSRLAGRFGVVDRSRAGAR